MCITFHYHNEDYPLILLNNRDEAIDRPTLPLNEWINDNGIKIYSGKDSIYGGTWLGINESGKYCVILNLYQEDKLNILPWSSSNCNNNSNNNENEGKKPQLSSPAHLTRGTIILKYLDDKDNLIGPKEYIESLENINIYNESNRGFILIIGDIKRSEHYYYETKTENIISLKSDEVFGISNYPLEPKCFKVENGKSLLKTYLGNNSDVKHLQINEFLSILKNNEKGHLPTTEHENVSSIFVDKFISPYDNLYHGTRTSSIILVDKYLNVEFLEINHMSNDSKLFEFKIKE